VFFLLFGIGIFLNSISLIFVFTPIFIFVTYIFLKYIEEPELEKRFGTEYLQYKKEVPMFMPRIYKRNINERM
ncbi:MAG: hypothetical protein WCJ49_08155, partial [Deltaproteobacteria bacterium]